MLDVFRHDLCLSPGKFIGQDLPQALGDFRLQRNRHKSEERHWLIYEKIFDYIVIRYFINNAVGSDLLQTGMVH